MRSLSCHNNSALLDCFVHSPQLVILAIFHHQTDNSLVFVFLGVRRASSQQFV